MGNKWKESNKKKSKQLGIPHGTASNRLRKSILFDLLKRLGENTCFQCDGVIETSESLSIEHKIPWLDSDDPAGLFFDLDNIAFSHLSCNCSSNRGNQKGENHPKSKLSRNEVVIIKQRLSNGDSYNSIASDFKVGNSTIWNIKHEHTWSHVKTPK